jgi:16S rRNA C1402 N4-methylase RsmH
MDVFDLPELSDIIMCYGEARGNRREARHIIPTAISSQKSSTTQRLLDFINAFKKQDLFILGMLVEDSTM